MMKMFPVLRTCIERIAGHGHAKPQTAKPSAPLVLFAVFAALWGMLSEPMPARAQSSSPATGQDAPQGEEQGDLQSAVPRVVLSGDIDSRLSLTPYLSWHVDGSRQLSLDDIRALPESAFRRSAHIIPSFGYTRDTIWYQLALRVEGPLNNRALLEVDPSYLNFVDLFLFRENQPGIIWQENLGDHVPASMRPYQANIQVTSLPSLAPGDYRMYIRVKSNGPNFIRLSLWSPGELISALTYRNMAANVFFGLFVTLGIAYSALGFLVRDWAVTTYGMWVIAVGAVVAIVNGLVLGELRPENPLANDVLLGTGNILSYAAVTFLWIHILDFRRRYPFAFRVCCVYLLLILGCLIGVGNDIYIFFGRYVVPSHALFMTIMCLVLIRDLLRDLKNRVLWSYLFVLVIPSIPAITLQLAHSGLIAVTPLRLELYQFSLLFHMIAMGVVMAVRLTRRDRDRIIASLEAEETTLRVEEQRNLIAMLSHEFRTPLAVIQRSSEMLMLRLKEHNQDVQGRLQRIQMQARKLARLVDIFLNKDGIENPEFSLAREQVSLVQFINEFVANTTRENAEVRANFVDADGYDCYIDATLIGLAITNLIETSRRFTHGQPVNIVVEPLSSWMVEISIPCIGHGLDHDEIGQIGDALFRHSFETKTLRSALGLHISQRIVDAHGGSIRLRMDKQDRVELCLLLPCERSSPVASPDKQATTRPA